jgi:RimJ/RimL family protein N-acetyltransferase
MGGMDTAPGEWLVRGELVALARPERETFIARWDGYNDARIAMLAAFQTAGATPILKPPVTREHREAVWDMVADGRLVAFDVLTVDDGRFVGEVGLARIEWPQAWADVGAALFDPADRGHGYGTEAVVLMCAYGFDALGLNRMMIRYLSVNEAVVQAMERSAAAIGGRLVGVEREAEWAYGAHRDRMVVEVLRADFPGHPATAHLRSRAPD